MLGRQRQAQQHFILNQVDKVDCLANQNRITVGLRLQTFQLSLAARQMQHPRNLDRMPHFTQATLTNQPHLALHQQLQSNPAELVRMAGDSTEQCALRKFICKTWKLVHIRMGIPSPRIPAKAPWVNYNRLKHGLAEFRRAGGTRTGSR
jgi:hypothetical protein